MRVVLDVNVLVSGIVTGDTAPSRIMDLWVAAMFELVVSEHVLEGVARAYRKPYWRQRYGDELVDTYLGQLRTETDPVRPDETVRGVAEDLEDDLVIATAVAGGADYLITGDRRLREIGAHGGVRILTPREFLDLLDDPLSLDPVSLPFP